MNGRAGSSRGGNPAGRVSAPLAAAVAVLATIGVPMAVASGLVEAPRLLEPAAGAVLDNAVTYPPDGTTWALRWSPVRGADAYRLEVSAPHLSEPFYDRVLVDAEGALLEGAEGVFRCYPGEAGCFAHLGLGSTPVPNEATSGWSWRMQARSGEVWGPWSEVSFFEVERLPDVAGTAALLEGVLVGWPGGEARLVAIAYPDWPPVAEAALAADGSFSILLPALVLPRDKFTIGDDEDPWIAVSNPFRSLQIGWFFVVQDETLLVGMATMATSLEAGDVFWNPLRARVGEAAVAWWFADRAAVMRDVGETVSVEFRYDLDLAPGWNVVVMRAVGGGQPGGPMVMELTTVAEPPDDVAWHWVSFEDLGGGGP